jgi:hypothetical protein
MKGNRDVRDKLCRQLDLQRTKIGVCRIIHHQNSICIIEKHGCASELIAIARRAQHRHRGVLQDNHRYENRVFALVRIPAYKETF